VLYTLCKPAIAEEKQTQHKTDQSNPTSLWDNIVNYSLSSFHFSHCFTLLCLASVFFHAYLSLRALTPLLLLLLVSYRTVIMDRTAQESLLGQIDMMLSFHVTSIPP
jgi:hypothetical protein